MNNTQQSTVRMGFLEWLTLLFIALKLMGYVEWSWWWVLSPIWIVIVLFVIYTILKEI